MFVRPSGTSHERRCISDLPESKRNTDSPIQERGLEAAAHAQHPRGAAVYKVRITIRHCAMRRRVQNSAATDPTARIPQKRRSSWWEDNEDDRAIHRALLTYGGFTAIGGGGR
jgi:hypothetical protein